MSIMYSLLSVEPFYSPLMERLCWKPELYYNLMDYVVNLKRLSTLENPFFLEGSLDNKLITKGAHTLGRWP